MPGIYLPEPNPDEMDQARDELIRRDEAAAPPGVAEVERILGEGHRSPVTITSSAAAQAPAVTGNAAPSRELPPTEQQPVPAAVSDEDLLAQFAELVLMVNAARFIS